jgi:hypothetical protein
MGSLVVNAALTLDIARSLMNDNTKSNWPDSRIFPKLQLAYRDMMTVLLLNGIPLVHQVSTIITVPGSTIDGSVTDLSTLEGYPTNMVVPIWMKERTVGESNIDFVDMTKCDFLPNTQQSQDELIWWCWAQQTITVIPAYTDVQVQLRFNGTLQPPQVNTDSIIVILGETYLGYRTAALCMASVGNGGAATSLDSMAAMNLDNVVRLNVKEIQDLPAKRGPYHRGRGRNRVLRDF